MIVAAVEGATPPGWVELQLVSVHVLVGPRDPPRAQQEGDVVEEAEEGVLAQEAHIMHDLCCNTSAPLSHSCAYYSRRFFFFWLYMNASKEWR